MVLCYSSPRWQRPASSCRHGWLQGFRADIIILFLSLHISALFTLSRLHSQKSSCPSQTKKVPPRFRLEGQPRWRYLLLSQNSQQNLITSHWFWWGHMLIPEPISVAREYDCLWPRPHAPPWFCRHSLTQSTGWCHVGVLKAQRARAYTVCQQSLGGCQARSQKQTPRTRKEPYSKEAGKHQ